MDFQKKEKYDYNDLLAIMKSLRSPEGCMWDKEQTHESIRHNVIEEAYEVADAIDRKDDEALCEELGDLLLQVVFHAQMASEENAFDESDVCDGICKKLVRRHPHIFGDEKLKTTEEIHRVWDKIKAEEKGQKSFSDTVEAVPSNFPALMRSEKVQARAAKSGFDYPDVDMTLDVLQGEVDELKEAVAKKDSENAFEELGDVIFSAVNVARFIDADSELALTRSCEKFIRRFKKVEALSIEKGIDMKKSSMDELNNLWREAKNTGV